MFWMGGKWAGVVCPAPQHHGAGVDVFPALVLLLPLALPLLLKLLLAGALMGVRSSSSGEEESSTLHLAGCHSWSEVALICKRRKMLGLHSQKADHLLILVHQLNQKPLTLRCRSPSVWAIPKPPLCYTGGLLRHSSFSKTLMTQLHFRSINKAPTCGPPHPGLSPGDVALIENLLESPIEIYNANSHT